MNMYVIDTQALVKFLNGKKVINDVYEKNRIPISIAAVRDILDNAVNYLEEKLSLDVIASAFEITDIPELHDRLIAGTARYLQLPLLTNDPVILKSAFVECVK